MLCLIGLTGCTNKTVIYPILDTDVYLNEKGDTCMSEFYVEEVLKAKINRK